MTKILLVRHGHVEGISPERFRGRADLPLTAGGWRASRRANGSPKTVTRITSICTASRSRWPRPSPSTSTRTSAAIGLCRGRGPRRRSDARPSWCTTHRRSTSRCEAGVFPCRTGKCGESHCHRGRTNGTQLLTARSAPARRLRPAAPLESSVGDPNVFEARAVVDAVDHRGQTLEVWLAAVRGASVEEDWAGVVLNQFPLDFPDDFFALLRV